MNRRALVTGLVTTVAASQLWPLARAAAASVDEAEIGRAYFAKLRESGDVLFDSAYYEHLNEVGAVVADTVRTRYAYPIRFYIVRGDSANAYSVPGGNIYVNEPLLALAKNRDELAGVLAHESGHMIKHHVQQRMSAANKANTGGSIVQILAQVLGGPLAGAAAGMGAGEIAARTDANLSRHIEAEADEEGLRIMAASGTFNPYGMIWFFQTMTATYGTGQNSYLRDHPLDGARIADLQHEIAAEPATFGRFKDTQQREVAYW